MKKYLLPFVVVFFALSACTSGAINNLFKDPDNERITTADPATKLYVPVKRITQSPGFHWFGYYDKLQCDPNGRYILGMRTDFEHRQPESDDMIEIGMVDLLDNCKWIRLGKSQAWGWQQGCMLQFIPGSADEVLWNDKEGDRFICRIMNIKTGVQRTLPQPVYALNPDGKRALTIDFGRLDTMRPGYGYAGIPDPYADILTPDSSGIWQVDLETGASKLIVSFAQAAIYPNPEDESFTEAKHWFNVLLFNPDGTRFTFLQRWRYPEDERNARYNSVGGFGTRLFTASANGTDLRIIDPYNYTSHFIWRDPSHILAWSNVPGKGDGFFIFEDSPTENIVQIGKEAMPRNGHCTYMPNTDWILNDTYPSSGERLQSVYLYHVPTGKRVPLADFYSPPEYKGEWRCDTHPRSTPDGNYVIVDSPGWEGRQMYILDVRDIVKI